LVINICPLTPAPSESQGAKVRLIIIIDNAVFESCREVKQSKKMPFSNREEKSKNPRKRFKVPHEENFPHDKQVYVPHEEKFPHDKQSRSLTKKNFLTTSKSCPSRRKIPSRQASLVTHEEKFPHDMNGVATERVVNYSFSTSACREGFF